MTDKVPLLTADDAKVALDTYGWANHRWNAFRAIYEGRAIVVPADAEPVGRIDDDAPGRCIWRGWLAHGTEVYAHPPADTVRELVDSLIITTASLAAALSLLESGGRESAASDGIFAMMLNDYRGSLASARTTLAKHRSQS